MPFVHRNTEATTTVKQVAPKRKFRRAFVSGGGFGIGAAADVCRAASAAHLWRRCTAKTSSGSERAGAGSDGPPCLSWGRASGPCRRRHLRPKGEKSRGAVRSNRAPSACAFTFHVAAQVEETRGVGCSQISPAGGRQCGKTAPPILTHGASFGGCQPTNEPPRRRGDLAFGGPREKPAGLFPTFGGPKRGHQLLAFSPKVGSPGGRAGAEGAAADQSAGRESSARRVAGSSCTPCTPRTPASCRRWTFARPGGAEARPGAFETWTAGGHP